MIEAKNLTKRFGSLMAVDHINAQIRDGSVFGLIGTNGAGKSTFLRMLSGVLKPDEGSVTIDGKEVYENVEVKSRFFYISDDQYFFSNSTPEQLMKFYMGVYPKFNKNRFIHLMDSFELDRKRKINTFSKGMKKQVSVICGVCAGTDYLFCDETFDGLDPVMRQTVKSIFIGDMEERNLTPIIASHNLRELEDICDHVGLLHKGGILLSKDLEDMKLNIHKLPVCAGSWNECGRSEDSGHYPCRCQRKPVYPDGAWNQGRDRGADGAVSSDLRGDHSIVPGGDLYQ